MSSTFRQAHLQGAGEVPQVRASGHLRARPGRAARLWMRCRERNFSTASALRDASMWAGESEDQGGSPEGPGRVGHGLTPSALRAQDQVCRKTRVALSGRSRQGGSLRLGADACAGATAGQGRYRQKRWITMNKAYHGHEGFSLPPTARTTTKSSSSL